VRPCRLRHEAEGDEGEAEEEVELLSILARGARTQVRMRAEVVVLDAEVEGLSLSRTALLVVSTKHFSSSDQMDNKPQEDPETILQALGGEAKLQLAMVLLHASACHLVLGRGRGR